AGLDEVVAGEEPGRREDGRRVSLPAACETCARRIADECLGFTDPRVMWAGGRQCGGYTDDPERVERELADCVDYARRCGASVSAMKRELHHYQRYHGLTIRERESA